MPGIWSEGSGTMRGGLGAEGERPVRWGADPSVGFLDGGRGADRNGAGALLVSGREVQGDRTPDGDPRKSDLAGDPKLVEQGCDVVGHRIEGKLAAHFLRYSSSAGVVAQHAARFREPRR